MQRRLAWLLASLVVFGCLAMGGCVVVPRRARVVAVAPAPVWIPGYWARGHVWVRGYWAYR